MIGGLLITAFLVLAGTYLAYRQWRALRVLAAEPFVADEDRVYRRGQAKRRAVGAVLFVLIGGMMGGYYLSGMDARMDAIGNRERTDSPPDGEPNPQKEDDKQFTKRVGYYWIGIMGLLFAAGCFAIFDFWATRKYWMARYKELKAEHEAKLQRDLAVFRQQKLNERAPGLKPPVPSDDTEESPPTP